MGTPKLLPDIWDHFDEHEKKMAARSIYQKIWDGTYWKLYRLWTYHLSPSCLWCQVKAFGQRRIRGFDDAELWSLDYTILSFILPRLKRFRIKARTGWPGPEQIFDIEYDAFQGLSEEEQEDLNARSLEEWKRMLDKMIRAIELQVEHGGIFIKPNPEWKEGDSRRDSYIPAPELEAEYKEGWKLFVEWFHALWD